MQFRIADALVKLTGAEQKLVKMATLDPLVEPGQPGYELLQAGQGMGQVFPFSVGEYGHSADCSRV